MDQGTTESASAVVGHPATETVSALERDRGLISRRFINNPTIGLTIVETWDMRNPRSPYYWGPSKRSEIT